MSTATLRRPTTWVLAAVLILWAVVGVRFGDTFFPDGRASHQVGVDR